MREQQVLIKIGPAKAQDLAAAHAGCDRDRGRALKARPARRRKDPLRKRSVDLGRLGAPGPGRLRARGRVGAKVAPANRLPQRLGEDQVQVQHGPARERPAGSDKQGCVQPLQVKRAQLAQGHLAKRRLRVQADQGLVALPGLGPDPATRMGEPALQVRAEARLLLGDLGGLHGSRMLAPASPPSKLFLGL